MANAALARSQPSFKPSEQDVCDAYVYLLGRLLVTRQQRLDFREGFQWNELLHRRPGDVDCPNPNLDVASSETWVAVDEDSYTLISVPNVNGRYCTVQFLNGWGETVANINPRVFPDQPYGEFAACLKGSDVYVPRGVTRVDLPVKYSRVLARVELGANWDEAVELQQQFTFTATGRPAIPTIPRTPLFDLEKLPGVEAFDAAAAALDSEADINPGMDGLQAITRSIARAVKIRSERGRIDRIIRERTLTELANAGAILGNGTIRNGWVRPATAGVYGGDFLTRTLVNFGGMWANVFDEVIYYKSALDSTGAAIHGDHVYTLTFGANALPSAFARYFWSVMAVDGKHMRVLPNRLNRFVISNESGLQYGEDGSLTLHFAAERPAGAPDANWLPTPQGQGYRLILRFYGPNGPVADGSYYPPPLVKGI
jgi:hypothetical protein